MISSNQFTPLIIFCDPAESAYYCDREFKVRGDKDSLAAAEIPSHPAALAQHFIRTNSRDTKIPTSISIGRHIPVSFK